MSTGSIIIGFEVSDIRISLSNDVYTFFFQILGFKPALNMFGGIPLYILMMLILFLLAVLMEELVAIYCMRSYLKG